MTPRFNDPQVEEEADKKKVFKELELLGIQDEYFDEPEEAEQAPEDVKKPSEKR